MEQIGIGTRVEYRGSLDDMWGSYLVHAVTDGPQGPLYDLADVDGTVRLHTARPTSIEPGPPGPMHSVLALVPRAHVVQSEIARQYNREQLAPERWESLDTLPRWLTDLVKDGRPVEAETYLLSNEFAAGMISYSVWEQRVHALVIAGDDRSWM